MPRATSSELREQAERKAVALLTQLMRPPDPGSNEAVARHALVVDGLADDILEADPEGGLLFVADVAARAITSLGETTGTDPGAVLQVFTQPAPEHE